MALIVSTANSSVSTVRVSSASSVAQSRSHGFGEVVLLMATISLTLFLPTTGKVITTVRKRVTMTWASGTESMCVIVTGVKGVLYSRKVNATVSMVSTVTTANESRSRSVTVSAGIPMVMSL